MAPEKIEYSCGNCGIEIIGTSYDIQEAPELYCPECGDVMNLIGVGIMTNDVPTQVRMRTDPGEDLGHRYE